MNDLITSLHLDEKALSNGGELLAVEIRQVKRYADGKPLENEFDYKCSVVAPMNGYAKYDVTVTAKPAFEPAKEGGTPVVFTGLTVKIYQNHGENYKSGTYGFRRTSSLCLFI